MTLITLFSGLWMGFILFIPSCFLSWCCAFTNNCIISIVLRRQLSCQVTGCKKKSITAASIPHSQVPATISWIAASVSECQISHPGLIYLQRPSKVLGILQVSSQMWGQHSSDAGREKSKENRVRKSWNYNRRTWKGHDQNLYLEAIVPLNLIHPRFLRALININTGVTTTWE